MAVYFLDSNAVVKRYLPERGQAVIQQLCDPTQGHDLYISQMAEVEVVYAIAKWMRVNVSNHAVAQKRRKNLLAYRDTRIAEFRRHCDPNTGQYGVIRLTSAEFQEASQLCHKHNITPQDALQLASALTLQREALHWGVSSLILVTADADFIDIIQRYGFQVVSPETTPNTASMIAPAPPPQRLAIPQLRWREWMQWVFQNILPRR